MDTTMAKTDAKSNGKVAEKAPAAVSNQSTPTPVSNGGGIGTIGITFLKTTEIPARKALGRKEGTGVWNEVVQALNKSPGTLAEVYHTTDAKEANARRNALIQAANRVGVEMDMKKTAVRDSGQKTDAGEIIFTVFAMVATEKVRLAQAAERGAREAALAKAAAEKGVSLEDYKASLPKRGRAAKSNSQAPSAQA